MSLSILPATPDRWDDLCELFDNKGAYSNCWCTWWRLANKEFSEASPAGRKALLQALVDSEVPPGLLAYRGGEPVGWMSLGARETFPRLQRSTKLKPVDAEPVCSVVCFFVHKSARRVGVAGALLEEAESYAARAGFPMLEGYPVEGKRRPSELFTGSTELFESHGFTEVGRRGGRPIVRKTI